MLLLDKPAGASSNAVLQRARNMLGAARAGHTGTLDPFATGLLIVCLGEATKYTAYGLHADKAYRATLHLGVTTTTGDTEGEVLATQPHASDETHFRAVLARFRGTQMQTPPMYSALKFEGRPLYEYARAGITIERPPRQIAIHSLCLVAWAPPYAVVDVHCSAGTYVRTLAEDIGAALGCGAHLAALRRTAAGGFTVAGAIALETLEGEPLSARRQRLLPAEAMVQHLPRCHLDPDTAARLRQGQRPSAPTGCPPGVLRAYCAEGFVGLIREDDGRLIPVRLAHTGAA